MIKTNSKADTTVLYLAFTTASAVGQMLTQPALAHTNHDHSQRGEDPSPTVVEQNGEQDTAPVTEATSDDASKDMVEQPSKPITESVAAPIPQEPITQARLFDGFSIGLGESLLGLILVGPFLLMSLKRMRN